MRLSDLTHPFRRDNNTASDTDQDLGFGSKIAVDGGRLINPDGTFNVQRRGYRVWTPYQTLVEMSWSRFMWLVVLFYTLINVVFALLFVICGPGCLQGVNPDTDTYGLFWHAFFFSIQTFTTVGYGALSPVGFTANIIASVDALVGLMSFALATGLVFARFSKPKANILFSEHAVIAPYRHPETGETIDSFQFRLVNGRDNQIINLEATVVLTWLDNNPDGKLVRRFATLPLERRRVVLFPLNWTIVHPIDADSPMYNMSSEQLTRLQAEWLIMIQGYDDTFAQNVHDTRSYTCSELRWGAKFAGMYHSADGITLLELSRLDTTIPVEEEE